jgi:hypothetical protein
MHLLWVQLRLPNEKEHPGFEGKTRYEVPECRQAQVLGVLALNAEHEVEHKEEEVPH